MSKRSDHSYLKPPAFNEETINEYVATHSVEQTIGYLEGIIEFYNFIHWKLYARFKDESWDTVGAGKFHNAISQFIDNNDEVFKKLGIDCQNLKAASSDSLPNSDTTLAP